jgi:hypothetical protein
LQIIIQGKASGNSTVLDYKIEELDELLLFFLRNKGVTIASSCDGEGVCKRCVIQNGWLTCGLTLKQFLLRQPDGKIEIDYL